MDPDKHIAKQFGEEEKALLICTGIERFELPREAKPVTPLARPFSKPARAQEKMKLSIEEREPRLLSKAR
jgi:hypothetical protein